MSSFRYVTAFLILIILTGTSVAVLHHHDNTPDYHDCPICAVSHHQQATGQSMVAFDGVPVIIEAVNIVPTTAIAQHLFALSLNNRAPPA